MPRATILLQQPGSSTSRTVHQGLAQLALTSKSALATEPVAAAQASQFFRAAQRSPHPSDQSAGSRSPLPERSATHPAGLGVRRGRVLHSIPMHAELATPGLRADPRQ